MWLYHENRTVIVDFRHILSLFVVTLLTIRVNGFLSFRAFIYVTCNTTNYNKHFEVIFPILVGVSLLLPMTETFILLHPLHHFSPNLPLTFMSLSTTFSNVIFGLPLPLLPSTVISILFFIQSFPSFLSTHAPSISACCASLHH